MPGTARIGNNQVNAVIAIILVNLVKAFADLQVPVQLVDENLLARGVHLQPLLP